MPKISVCIPAYEYNGLGVEVLELSFKKMEIQNFKDFDVVISDHSIDNKIKDLCKQWENKLDIKYIRNEKNRGSPSANFNNAMRNCTGKYIKLLCQDDYFLDENSLSTIFDGLDNEHNWLASKYFYTNDRNSLVKSYTPSLNDRIMIVNTIGTPSCVIIKNFFDDNLWFDENLLYCWDCEFYYRFIRKYGDPKIIYDNTIVNYLWKESITSSITQETINKENDYILKKHSFIKD